MTQPDELFPDDAQNADSFADFAAKTQSEWEDEQRGAEVARWSILTFLEGIPFIGDIIAALDGIDWGTPGAVLQAIADALEDVPVFGPLLETLAKLVGGQADADGENFITLLFSLLRPEWLPEIPFTSIGDYGDDQPNLLLNPGFDESVSVAGGGIWEWDGTDGRTTLGCASIACDGVEHALLGNDIPCSQGQNVSLSVWTKWSGFTGSSSPIRLDIKTFNNGVPVDTITVDAVVTPGSSGGWVELSDTYEIPAGVTSYRSRLVVTADAASGTVKFDDAENKKTTQTFFGNLLSLLGLNVLGDLQGVIDRDGIWSDLIEFVLNPLEVIEDVLARVRGQGIIDRIFGGFNNLGELGDEDNPIEAVLSSIFGIFDTGLTANGRAAQLESRIIVLESSANTIVESFTGASASSLGGNWSQSYSGGGSGNLGLDGKGNGVWKPSGAGSRICVARYTASALTTNNCVLQWVLSSTPQSYIFDDAYTYVNARMNTAATTYVRVRSGYDSVRIQAVVSGTVTNVGSSWSGNPKAGDQFEWIIGDPGDTNNRHHVLKRNGVTLLDFTETTSTYGGSNLHVGMGTETGNRLVLFQNVPAGLGVLTAAEVL